MLYRDFMQKFRPLYAPDVGGAPDGAAAAVTDAAASSSAAEPAAVPAAAPVDAPAAAAPTESAPSLLEAAAGKPKPDGDAAAAKPEAGAEVKKDEPAPAEAAKPDAKDAKPEGEKPKDDAAKDAAKTDPDAKDATAAEPPAPIKYEAFKLPDGLKLDDKELNKFSEFAGKAQIPQDVAQGLIDMYVAERQQDVVNARAEQRKHWNTIQDGWKTELRNNPELGGNRLETSLSLAKAVVEEYGGTPEQQQEFWRHVNAETGNGMGNYTGFVRLLHNIGKSLNIFEDGIVPANAQAPKATKGPGQRGWYDKSLNAPSVTSTPIPRGYAGQTRLL